MDPSLQPFSIYERAPGRFNLCGELDMATAAQLTELEHVEGPLLLDLRDVSFIDSCGIAGLLRLYRRCQRDGCAFLIESCSRPVERVLRIVGLYEIFTEDGARPGPELPSSIAAQESGAAASD
jgi:anti-anti-sigma factor